jgi:hypothetical protein
MQTNIEEFIYKLPRDAAINLLFGDDCKQILAAKNLHSAIINEFIETNIISLINKFKYNNVYINYLEPEENKKELYKKFILACSLPGIIDKVHIEYSNINSPLTKDAFQKYIFFKLNDFTSNTYILLYGILFTQEEIDNAILLKNNTFSEHESISIVMYKKVDYALGLKTNGILTNDEIYRFLQHINDESDFNKLIKLLNVGFTINELSAGNLRFLTTLFRLSENQINEIIILKQANPNSILYNLYDQVKKKQQLGGKRKLKSKSRKLKSRKSKSRKSKSRKSKY